jgi:hypothetical protein
MKVLSIILISCLLLVLGYWVYGTYISKSSRVYKQMNKVKTGMTQQQVTAVLSAPDTVYAWDENNDTLLVMHYDMGFAAPDALRVWLHHDSVTAITYNQ